MKKHIDYKVPGGKLIRMDIEIDKGMIKDIEITGDFFVHPENGIRDIENSLKGVSENQVKIVLERTLRSKGIKLIGFSAEDIEKAISSLKPER